MFYRSAADQKLVSLEARISRLENRISKRAGHQIANPATVAFQVKELKNAFRNDDADVLVVEPLNEFPSTHVIKVVTFNNDGMEVSLDIHLNNEMIIEIACFISSRVNKRVAYAKPTLDKVMGQDLGFTGEKLNFQTALDLAKIATTL